MNENNVWQETFSRVLEALSGTGLDDEVLHAAAVAAMRAAESRAVYLAILHDVQNMKMSAPGAIDPGRFT